MNAASLSEVLPAEAPSKVFPPRRSAQLELGPNPQRDDLLKELKRLAQRPASGLRRRENKAYRAIVEASDPRSGRCDANYFELARHAGISLSDMRRALARLNDEQSSMPPHPKRGANAEPRPEPLGIIHIERVPIRYADCPISRRKCNLAYRSALRAYEAARAKTPWLARPTGCVAHHGRVILWNLCATGAAILAKLEGQPLYSASRTGGRAKARAKASNVVRLRFPRGSQQTALMRSSDEIPHPFKDQETDAKSPPPLSVRPTELLERADTPAAGASAPESPAPAASAETKQAVPAEPARAPSQSENETRADERTRARSGPTSAPARTRVHDALCEEVVAAWRAAKLPDPDNSGLMIPTLRNRADEIKPEELAETLMLAVEGVRFGQGEASFARTRAQNPFAVAFRDAQSVSFYADVGRKQRDAHLAMKRREERAEEQRAARHRAAAERAAREAPIDVTEWTREAFAKPMPRALPPPRPVAPANEQLPGLEAFCLPGESLVSPL